MPSVVIRVISLVGSVNSVYQRLPSGPVAMSAVPPVGAGSSTMAPDAKTTPTLGANASTNQRLPSGPTLIPDGAAPAVGTGNSLMTPSVVIRPTLLPAPSVNQRFPSGPATMARVSLFSVGMEYSSKTW